MRLCALFSGGKDSTMTVHRAIRENHEVAALLTMIPENDESHFFHHQNIRLTKYPAEALGMPLISRETIGRPPQENQDMQEALKEIKRSYKVEGVAAGAVASNYQYRIVSEICGKLGLRVYAPYWGKKHEELIKETIREGFETIFVGVAAEGLDESWLGRRLDGKALLELKKLNQRFGLSVGGEGGEYETLVLDAPLFRKKIKIKKARKKWEKTRGELVIEDLELIEKIQDP